MSNCPHCGKNLELVGKAHHCAGSISTDMANAAMANKPDMANKGESKAYLYRDPVARRKYQRDYMRKKREAEKTSASA